MGGTLFALAKRILTVQLSRSLFTKCVEGEFSEVWQHESPTASSHRLGIKCPLGQGLARHRSHGHSKWEKGPLPAPYSPNVLEQEF